MKALSISEFKDQMADSFHRVDEGHKVHIKMNDKVYTLVPVEKERMAVTPELQTLIDKAHQEEKEGKCITVHSLEELNAYMDSL